METEYVVHMGSGGRFVIPAKLRKAIGLQPGDPVILRLEEESLIVTTPERAIRAAQAIVRGHVPAGRRLSAELIEERRHEADHE